MNNLKSVFVVVIVLAALVGVVELYQNVTISPITGKVQYDSSHNICFGGMPNGVLESGEECDDGNQDKYDGCTLSCIAAKTRTCIDRSSEENLARLASSHPGEDVLLHYSYGFNCDLSHAKTEDCFYTDYQDTCVSSTMVDYWECTENYLPIKRRKFCDAGMSCVEGTCV